MSHETSNVFGSILSYREAHGPVNCLFAEKGYGLSVRTLGTTLTLFYYHILFYIIYYIYFISFYGET